MIRVYDFRIKVTVFVYGFLVPEYGSRATNKFFWLEGWRLRVRDSGCMIHGFVRSRVVVLNLPPPPPRCHSNPFVRIWPPRTNWI